jgi:hypothetical protein
MFPSYDGKLNEILRLRISIRMGEKYDRKRVRWSYYTPRAYSREIRKFQSKCDN